MKRMDAIMTRKFENIDILHVLRRIMEQNTAHYQMDFQYDENIIRKNALSDDKHDKTLFWLSRPCGTNCYTEWEIFQKDSWAYTVIQHHAEQESEHKLSCVVELTGIKKDLVRGNLYPVDYMEYWTDVQKHALSPDMVEVTFENKETRIFLPSEVDGSCLWIKSRYGPIEQKKPVFSDTVPLERLLEVRKTGRVSVPAGNIERYIHSIRKGPNKIQ